MDDWGTVALSAGLSAVVSALVSLLAVSQMTVRRARAERREQARQELKKALQPLRADVRKYQARLMASLKRESAAVHGDDYAVASQIIGLIQALPGPQRFLVRRRAERIFGPLVWRTAEVAPLEGDSLGSFAALLAAQYEPGKLKLRRNGKRLGALHEALTHDPGSPEVARIERDLARLAAGW